MKEPSEFRKALFRLPKINMNRFEPKMRQLYATLRGFADGREPIHLTEDQLQKAEERLGSRLPEDYREFIRDFGDFTLNAVIKSQEENYRCGVGEFTYIGSEQVKRSYDDSISYYLEEDVQYWEKGAICIGMDGNVPIFLFFEGENNGRIYFKDYEDLIFVANSFEEFMEMLRNEFEEPYVEHEMEAIKEDTAPFWATFSTA